MNFDKCSDTTDEVREWTHTSLVWFWHENNPFCTRYATEKMTGILLKRDAADTEHLSYCGVSTTGDHTRSLRLRFEAVIQGRNLYSLWVGASAPRKWTTEESFLKTARRTLEFWSGKLTIPTSDTAWQDNLPTLYQQRKSDALDAEAEAAVPLDESLSIKALQQEILAAMRSGMIFFTANKEGGTHLKFDGESFLRSDYGEDPRVEKFATDAEMLVCLRKFFDWDSRRNVHPHLPPEREVWQYIRTRLMKSHA